MINLIFDVVVTLDVYELMSVRMPYLYFIYTIYNNFLFFYVVQSLWHIYAPTNIYSSLVLDYDGSE